ERRLAGAGGREAEPVWLEGEAQESHDGRVVGGDQNRRGLGWHPGWRGRCRRRRPGDSRCRVPLSGQVEHLPLGGGEYVEVSVGGRSTLATDLHEPIQRRVVTERIMMKQGQTPGPGGEGVVHRPLRRGVAPSSSSAGTPRPCTARRG